MNAPRSMCGCTWPRPARFPIAFNHRWAVSAVEAEVADVGLAGFADPQPVAPEEHRESSALAPELFGGEQEPAGFSAVHPMALARMDLRASNVLRRVRPDPPVDVREPVVAAHRRQPPVDRRGREFRFVHLLLNEYVIESDPIR